ncbi:virB8 family protein [Novosphingobium mangrovi (ex Huang et al. 2023)]|uniref:VirB8/TrbF family protein n=1 Tax=Novosphingobium mangrovi (ex Huang et al. 2023) TaxID=2976432 RepID=A0ABT2IAJ9_9SPHN|nr:VirB8/TrbF family protein [Novosphingobium mangrovi (ex Huang et al. 2023)]MCT2401855.1 VirB8/TrbF family protein [Novosphingobium mangrovi (ex Huang et al. 2023)]
MNDMSDDELTRYYEEAGSWSADRNKGLATSKRVAWIIAGLATGVAVLEAIALAALVPLKTVVPYTLLVDRQTGNVEALKPLDQQTITPDNALVRSFLAQYVTARESFDINSIRGDYRKVALWSTGAARERYLKAMQSSNPASPFKTLPRQALVETEVRSISSLGKDTALVRFATYRTDPGGQRQAGHNWAAVITYRFSTARMSASDRLINPLGFQVLRYRRDAEMVVPAAGPSASASGPQEAPNVRQDTRP